ncbi:MAG: cell division protein FtsA [Candidatus Sumerlaeota bacterium]|nr:cell division protein FtsA [Candidatus Sumerlaeota bacterium]
MKSRIRRPEVFTGLDIGTTKIACIIGMHDAERNTIRVLGMASQPSHGLKQGMVQDIDKTIEAIQQAVHNAKKIANTDATNIFVGIAGEHISCRECTASVDISNSERGVTEVDVKRALALARPGDIPPGFEPIQVIPTEFICDLQGGVVNPVNVRCSKLGVRVLAIIASVNASNNILHCVNNAGLKVSELVLQSLASSMAVLSDDLKDLGCALIDIGGGTTDISVFYRGSIRYIAVIPEGGDGVTRAVAEGLGVVRYDAENIKKRFGHARADTVDPEERIEVVGLLRKNRVPVRRRDLAAIIEDRMEALLMRAREKLAAQNLLDNLHAGVVLTGGAALTEGLIELAERVFDKPVIIGVPQGLLGVSGQIASPIYSTGVGLVQYGVLCASKYDGRRGRGDWWRDVFNRWFQKY